MIEDRVERAIAGVVDRLVVAAKALPGDVGVTRHADGIAIEGAGLRLRRIADPRLRDLIGTARSEP